MKPQAPLAWPDRPALDPHVLASLRQTANAPALRALALHVGWLLALGWLFVVLWQAGNGLGVALVWVLYSAAFAFLGYAGLGHELNHRTVFRSRALNEVLFHAVSVLTWNNAVYFRASHQIHHAHTLTTGVDHEVQPTASGVVQQWWKYGFFDWAALNRAFTIFWMNVRGQVKGPLAERVFTPGADKTRRLVLFARITVLFHASVFLAAVLTQSWWWVALVNLAAFGHTWLNRVVARLQHEGMVADGARVQETTRTVSLPRWLSLLYWNMNYHIEHHCYPAVPFHHLPGLHQTLRAQGQVPAPRSLRQSLQMLGQFSKSQHRNHVP